MIHLDTSFLIRALVAGTAEDRRLRTWIREGESLRVSAIVWCEFLCGPVGSNEIALASRIVGDPEGFLAADALEASRLYNVTGRRRGTLVDCMIAAVAARDAADLATANRQDFQRLSRAGGPSLARA